jgi:hypothetical protein
MATRTTNMWKRSPLFIPSVLILACVPALSAAEPEKQNEADKGAKDKAYEIRIARSVPVGTKYALTADGALLRQVTLHVAGREQKQPDDGFGIHLEGTVEVLALDDVGEEAKVSCVVDKCNRITSEGEKELVPKGKVLIAEGKGKDTKFHYDDGTELPKVASEALELAISLDTGDEVTDDDMFGTKDKQAIGGSWPVHADAVAKDAARVGVIVKPEDVEGSFKLDGLKKVGDVECMKVSGNLRMKKLLRKDDEDDGLPAGFTVTGGSMEARYGGLFPLDVSAGGVSESASMTFITNVKGKGGPGGNQELKIESRVQRAAELKRRFLK